MNKVSLMRALVLTVGISLASMQASATAGGFNLFGKLSCLCSQSTCDECCCDGMVICEEMCESPVCGCECEMPVCGCEFESSCGCEFEPVCGCEFESSCGCEFEPACGCEFESSCGCEFACDTPCCDPCCCDSLPAGNCGVGNYLSLFGGWNQLDGYRGGAAPVLAGTFSDGWLIGGAIGRRLGTFRGEAEFGFRSNTADQWSVGGATGDWSGHGFVYTGMANLLYDFQQCNCGGITPYAGAGLGLALVDGEFGTAATAIDIEDEAFAYQFMAGASKHIGRGVELFSEYRYFATTEIQIFNTGVAPAVEVGQYELNVDNVLVGLRWMR